MIKIENNSTRNYDATPVVPLKAEKVKATIPSIVVESQSPVLERVYPMRNSFAMSNFSYDRDRNANEDEVYEIDRAVSYNESKARMLATEAIPYTATAMRWSLMALSGIFVLQYLVPHYLLAKGMVSAAFVAGVVFNPVAVVFTIGLLAVFVASYMLHRQAKKDLNECGAAIGGLGAVRDQLYSDGISEADRAYIERHGWSNY